MLIVSDFHDYYDSITAHGIDKTVVYQRTPSNFALEGRPLPTGAHGRRQTSYEFQARLLGFCGRFYPLIEFETFAGTRRAFIYDAKAAVDLIKRRDTYFTEDKRAWRQTLSNAPTLRQFFSPDTGRPFAGFFQKHKVPAFVIGGELVEGHSSNKQSCILNPRLEDFGFQSVVDPYTAFQDIYMYLSGVLGVSAPATVTIDDKHKAIAHGHDGKYSFRKPPGGGRWR